MFNQKTKAFLFLVLFIVFMFPGGKTYASDIGTKAVLEISWDINEDADYYESYYRPLGTLDWTSLGTTSGSKMNIVLPESNKDYELSVKGFNLYGNSSDFSDPIRVNPLAFRPPTTPLEKITEIVISVKIIGDVTAVLVP